MKSKKIILDTNLWISFLISNDFIFLDNYIEKGKVVLIFSEELFEEIITVAERPKFKKFFNQNKIDYLISLISKLGKPYKVTSEINLCRDIKDNFLLNLAVDSKADYLISGDKDLLDLKSVQKTKIITIKELIEILQKKQ